MTSPDLPPHQKTGQFRHARRPVDGILLLDKPPRISSNQALQMARRLFMARKAGHTGTLDPMATGLLPVCLGEATKFSSALLGASKTYEAVLRLGYLSTTGDAEGEISACDTPVSGMRPPAALVEAVLQSFVGPIMQIPPMHSALKHQGKPLYHYARAGVEIERPPRPVVIHALQVTAIEENEMRIIVRCSAGTYVRTLAEDIGRALGCGGAYLTALRRNALGGFNVLQACTLDALEAMQPAQRDACLYPVDALLQELPAVILDDTAATALLRGQNVPADAAAVDAGEGTNIRIYDLAGGFLGLGAITPRGAIAPKRLVNRSD
ncbi:tRNA pseudouridine(55) synthase TruB [Nitrosovibrio sp. Nv17]|uniref:tRNA pseudouridine(55) synthase TruB n=1 Tax=Nitrosovibrio sp. Nv17 TaxID=1855339 RepID=UPI000908E856|nr:tRNA pseudouridine(55) synthase TruB [Nitrosovibrio sp. Nv17]SFW32061.1 tRNA pseudouridine synthase B [Nitrosovibrio sp. Nv17]